MLQDLLQQQTDPAPCTLEEFGPALATFEDTAREDMSLTIGELLRLGGALFVIGSIVTGGYALLSGNPDWGVVVLMLTAGVFSLPLTYTLIKATFGTSTTVRRAVVHECGLVLWRGGELHTIPWADMVQLYEASTLRRAGKRILGTTVSVRLIVAPSGDIHDLRASMIGIADLVLLLREQLLPLLEDRAAAAVRRGEAVDFGHWRVNDARVADVSQNRTLAWGDITSIEVTGGMIRLLLWPQEVWAAAPVAHIPNARIFVAVAERCTGRPATLGKHAWIAVEDVEE